MNLYDLRYPKHSSLSYSKSFVEFPDYQNQSTPGYLSGFDVNPKTNLIAAACDDARVMLFDASSGTAVWEKFPVSKAKTIPGQILNPPSRETASCVRFVDRKDGQSVISVASDRGLEEWSWNR